MSKLELTSNLKYVIQHSSIRPTKTEDSIIVEYLVEQHGDKPLTFYKAIVNEQMQYFIIDDLGKCPISVNVWEYVDNCYSVSKKSKEESEDVKFSAKWND